MKAEFAAADRDMKHTLSGKREDMISSTRNSVEPSFAAGELKHHWSTATSNVGTKSKRTRIGRTPTEDKAVSCNMKLAFKICRENIVSHTSYAGAELIPAT
jgi:hypothetical protein